MNSEEYEIRNRDRPSQPIDIVCERELVVVDVGAQKLADEEHIYSPLVGGTRCRVIGFEPLEHRRAEMTAADPSLLVLPYFIGDGSEQTFYVNNDDATSSLLPLNVTGVADLGHLHTLRTVNTERVPTKRLDDVLSNEEVVDFLKLDIQGFELQALIGAEEVLKRTNVVHCEIEFLQIYEEQPLFSEVEIHLRSRGFQFIDFTTLCRYPFLNASSRQSERLGWGDAVFFRDGGDAKAQAAIASLVYGKTGLARYLIDRAR